MIKLPLSKTFPFALAAVLSGVLLLSAIMLIADLDGFINVLGWSKRPGYLISFLLGTFALVALYRHESIVNVSSSVALLVVSMSIGTICDFVRLFADIFPLPPFLWLLVTVLPLLLGCCCVHHMRLKGSIKVTYFVCASYIESVHFYNMLCTEQHMVFFGGGWTA